MLTLGLLLSASASAQKPDKQITPTRLCSNSNALELLREQVAVSKGIDNPVARITALIKAADLFWTYDQRKSRETFTDAFDFATQYYVESTNAPRRDGRLQIKDADQRYRVIVAISKHDPAWGQKLTQNLLEEEQREAEQKTNSDAAKNARTAENLLYVATSLLSSNSSMAMIFAENSLNYPATLQLPTFLYKLGEIEKPLADKFYRAALMAYANAPMDQFLYLSSYPFGNDREVGEMPSTYRYSVPNAFVPNPMLQRLFIQSLLNRAQQAINNRSQTGPAKRFSDEVQMWTALTRLEEQIRKSSPDLVPAAKQAQENLSALVTPRDRQYLGRVLSDPVEESFAEQLANAARERNPEQREQALAFAVLSAAKSEPIEKIIDAAQQIEDSRLRDQLLNRVYFERSQQAINSKDFEKGRRMASQIQVLDERAYLYSKIVEQSIETMKNDAVARELLEEVISAATKAPDTEVKVRTLLTVAFLYTKVDLVRSVMILSDAVRCINQIESPTFSDDYIIKRIEGKVFGSYVTLRTPGFDPQNGFREIAKYDFDGTLYQANSIRDKYLRVMVMMALVDLCLKQKIPPHSLKKTSKR
jgi:hypothetical protein